jgi:hypothetical protein
MSQRSKVEKFQCLHQSSISKYQTIFETLKSSFEKACIGEKHKNLLMAKISISFGPFL